MVVGLSAIDAVEDGGSVVQETRMWSCAATDVARGVFLDCMCRVAMNGACRRASSCDSDLGLGRVNV